MRIVGSCGTSVDRVTQRCVVAKRMNVPQDRSRSATPDKPLCVAIIYSSISLTKQNSQISRAKSDTRVLRRDPPFATAE